FNVFNVKIISIKVFASQTLSNPNSLWIVLDYDQKNESNPIIYGKSIVYFLNKGVNENIVISRNYKSPSTGNWE
ncbi:21421_t:CDS:1, partial [Rhizophagus irregularis]